MISAIIIDDEKNGIELVANMLKLYCSNVNVLATANSVETGYNAVKKHNPDLIFLDVQMQDGTGFDLLKRFDEIEFKVIFVTAFEQHAIEAFRFSAVDYILKPISPDYLIKAVKKTEEALEISGADIKVNTLLSNVNNPAKEARKIVLKTADRIYSLSVKEIIRCESDGSYTYVYLNDGKKILTSRSLKEFDDLLIEYKFFRAHKSHLVNTDYIDFYEKMDSMIIMKDKSSIPVSSRKKDQLIYLMENM